jgi:metal-responsive CopG/Arc/MetJ family transcriptional regulator
MIAKEKVTLTLPLDVMEAVRTHAAPRQQSQFIAQAIEYFIAEKQRKSLRERLIAGYQANAAADIEIAAAWSSLEDEALLNHIPTIEMQDSANDSANAHPNSAR